MFVAAVIDAAVTVTAAVVATAAIVAIVITVTKLQNIPYKHRSIFHKLLGLVFLPGLVRGCYELLRSPIVYEARASDGGGGGTSNFTLRKRKRRNQLLSGDASFLRRALNNLPESLSFGLDVLPRASFKMPGQAGMHSEITVFLLLLASLLMMPVYVLIMALWFPFLPLIQ